MVFQHIGVKNRSIVPEYMDDSDNPLWYSMSYDTLLNLNPNSARISIIDGTADIGCGIGAHLLNYKYVGGKLPMTGTCYCYAFISENTFNLGTNEAIVDGVDNIHNEDVELQAKKDSILKRYGLKVGSTDTGLQYLYAEIDDPHLENMYTTTIRLLDGLFDMHDLNNPIE